MISIAVNSQTPMFTNSYDNSGNITSETLPDGSKFEYHYTQDPNGRGNVLVPDSNRGRYSQASH